MERSLVTLVVLFAILALASSLTVAVPLFGLSTILGVSVLGSSVLGSSVLGSSVLASTTIVEAYSGAIIASQLWLSIVAIGMLAYLELTDSAYGRFRRVLVDLRKSWLPISAMLVVLFFVIVALRIYAIASA
jgi:hypothetical protein